MQFLPHAEGYVEFKKNQYLYTYQYKVHLGNARLCYADLDGRGEINLAEEILEEKNYYPFGLQHDGYNMGVKDERSVEAEQIKYNGKEFEDSFGLNMYEMDLRQYDPAIGRWIVQDPVVHHDFSPYSAFDNNPVYWADPNGADAVPILDGDKTIGWEFSGDAIGEFYDYFNQYTNNNFEATYTNFYEMVSLNESEGGGNGNGNGGIPNWVKVSWYLYLGPTNGVNYNGIGLFGSNFIGPGPDVDPNTLGLKPLDLIDYAAFQHDMAYFRAKASGVDGALNNNNVRYADKKLVSDALIIMNGYLNGKIDPFTKQKISMKTYKMAEMVAYAFGAIDISKSTQIKVNMFLILIELLY